MSMLESEEKSHHRLPLSLLKSKDGEPNNLDDEDEEDIATEQQREEDFVDEDPEADFPDALRSVLSRLLSRQDELARRQ